MLVEALVGVKFGGDASSFACEGWLFRSRSEQVGAFLFCAATRCLGLFGVVAASVKYRQATDSLIARVNFGLFVHTILGWFTVVYFGLTVFGDNFGLRSVEVCCAEHIGFVYHCLNYCGYGVRRWCSLLISPLFGCVRPLVVLITIVLRLNVTAYNKAQKCILKLTKLM